MNKIEIDRLSGCCFGVAKAIARAEEELKKDGTLYCLGDIVHNSIEVKRLEKMGMITINHEQLKELRDVKVLLRAHGEPPSTYEMARRNNLELIDATCPVVLGLQKKVRKHYEQGADKEIQIVIYGKRGHAEVKGLMGQTRGSAIIIESKEEIDKLDFSRNISLFSQTTKPLDDFYEIGELIRARMKKGATLFFNDSICRQVSNRVPHIREFATSHDLIIFIAGEKSSNGKALFNECVSMNPHSYLIHTPEEVNPSWLRDGISIGICGATSTPQWQMEAVADILTKMRPSVQPVRAAF